ncbi:hypothetical protein, partial [Desulfovibrio sp. 1214_IL3152]|uniref:hypothetical protein n=1 Tax=Desulfovibrio sp. 1214_IL3152 TaxID=3084056 RepID=UPI002FD91FC2
MDRGGGTEKGGMENPYRLFLFLSGDYVAELAAELTVKLQAGAPRNVQSGELLRVSAASALCATGGNAAS